MEFPAGLLNCVWKFLKYTETSCGVPKKNRIKCIQNIRDLAFSKTEYKVPKRFSCHHIESGADGSRTTARLVLLRNDSSQWTLYGSVELKNYISFDLQEWCPNAVTATTAVSACDG